MVYASYSLQDEKYYIFPFSTLSGWKMASNGLNFLLTIKEGFKIITSRILTKCGGGPESLIGLCHAFKLAQIKENVIR